MATHHPKLDPHAINAGWDPIPDRRFGAGEGVRDDDNIMHRWEKGFGKQARQLQWDSDLHILYSRMTHPEEKFKYGNTNVVNRKHIDLPGVMDFFINGIKKQGEPWYTKSGYVVKIAEDGSDPKYSV